MRADRLLRIIFRLQDKGVVPASTLARELEVSVRTIRRDMEALSTAGIPVYSVRGGAGGWALVDDYRTSLTGLSSAEALATIVGQPRGLLSDLGLDDPGEDLVRKLLAAVAPAAREQADHARQRIHVDPDLYWEPTASNPAPILQQLMAASWDNRIVDLRYGSNHDTSHVGALGLIRKGARWYLIGQAKNEIRTYRVSRIHDVTTTEATFSRPADFDLAAHWQRSQQAYARRFGSYPIRLRLRGEALTRAGWAFARSKTLSEPDSDGWVDADFDTEDWDGAIGLVGSLGADLIVISPEPLRQAAVSHAARLLELNR